MSPPTKFDLGPDVRISPPVWPGGEKLEVQPGDLSMFTYGDGFYPPPGQKSTRVRSPLNAPPSCNPAHGAIFFDNDITFLDLGVLLRILEVRAHQKDFAVFVQESGQPGKDGYLVQMRLVSAFALTFLFHALGDCKELPPQKLSIEEAIWRFFRCERERWGVSFMEDRTGGLRGLFGGDGNYAREQLSFGIVLEDRYYGVWRVLSRAWLVTK